MKLRTIVAPHASLFLALAAAKATVFALRALDGIPFRAWRLLSALTHEVMLCATLFVVDALLQGLLPGGFVRPWSTLLRIVRLVLVAVAVVNVPVMRVLGAPFGAAMMGAASSTLVSSILPYATLGSATGVGIALCLAVLAFRRWGAAPRAGLASVVALASLLVPTDLRSFGLEQDPTLRFLTSFGSFGGAVLDPRGPVEGACGAASPGTDLRTLAGIAKGRHVVWVILESTRAGTRAAGGMDPMPNLTALAQHGVSFESAQAVVPESIRGLHSMLCSRTPRPRSTAKELGADECQSVASQLSDDGYRTALYHSGRFSYLGMDGVVRNRGFEVLADAKSIRGAHVSSFGTADHDTAAAVIKRFDALAPGERLMVTYMPIAGHHPYESPGEGPRPFGDASAQDSYRSDLYRGDLALGEIVAGLKARGLFEQTLFVVHGDHGEAFFEHEGNLAHSLRVYEENLQVPLVIAAPGAIRAPLRSSSLVSLLDVAPTMADLVGTKAARSWQGQSALSGARRRAFSFADQATVLLSVREGPFKLIAAESGALELYRLDQDPRETTNLAPLDPSRTACLARSLSQWARGGPARGQEHAALTLAHP